MAHRIDGNRFLVTGGSSLVGSHLADALLAAGAREVRLFDNLSLGTAETIAHLEGDARVTVIRGDILRLNELIDAAQSMDGIFAIAGFLTLPMSQNPPLGVAVNVMGMINTAEAARIAGVKRVVFASSLSAYGQTDADQIVETMPFGAHGLPPASAMYGASKVLGESIGLYYRQKHGIEFNALRFSSIYGERQHRRALNALFIVQAWDAVRAGRGPEIAGDGAEVHDYIHVADIAAGCVAAMAADEHGHVFNIATGVDTTLNEIVDIVLDVTGRRDLRPVHLADTRTVRSASVPRLNISREKAQALLGWTPQVSVRDGVARLIRWLEAQPNA